MSGDRTFKVTILGDSASAEKALDNVAKSTGKVNLGAGTAQKGLSELTSVLTNRLGPASGEAKKLLDNVGKSAIDSGSALTMGVAAGGAVAGVALLKFASDGVSAFASLAGEVRSFQRVSGASAEDASRLVGAVKLLGIEPDSVSRSFGLMSKSIELSPQKLSEFGVQVAKNKDGTDNLVGTLYNASEAFNATKNQSTKTALALTVFGKSGRDMIPILARGKEGLKELFDQVERHGEVFSAKDLESARQFSLQTREMGQAFQGLEIQAGKALLPFLTHMAAIGEKVASLGVQIDQHLGGGLSRSLESTIVGSVTGPIGQALDLLVNKTDGAAAATKAKAVEDAKAKAELDALGISTEGVSGHIADQKEALKAEAKAQAEATKEAKAFADALDKVLTASESLIGGELAVRTSQEELKKQLASTTATVNDRLGAVDALAKAEMSEAATQAEAAGQALTSSEKYGVYRESLIKVKDTLAPGSPLRLALEGFINQLPPPEVKTKILVDMSQAEAAIAAYQKLLLTIPGSHVGTIGSLFPGPGGTAPHVSAAPANVTIHVAGSVVSEEKLVAAVRRGLQRNASRNVSTGIL
jgi:hypothetical protein